MPLPIRACPGCGAAGMRPPRLGEGGVPGTAETSDRALCPRCGFQGIPAEFRAHADDAAFLASPPCA